LRIDKVVEDLQLAVERLDELLIGLNPHYKLWQLEVKLCRF
jgi:hypothetical protein